MLQLAKPTNRSGGSLRRVSIVLVIVLLGKGGSSTVLGGGPGDFTYGSFRVDPSTLDFSSNGVSRTFTLCNLGGGVLSFNIFSDVNWLAIRPDHGWLGNLPQTIEVTIDRNSIFVGPHEAQLTVRTDADTSATVLIHASKPVTTPLIVPWLEVNNCTPEEIDTAVAGLLIWHRITDTALISTVPDREWLYTELRARSPGMTILPGIKTVYRLGEDGFTSPSGWQAIAISVGAAAATSGQPHVLLENETALAKYWYGGYEIDFDLLRADLALLPQNVEIIWYPQLLTRDQNAKARAEVLYRAVQEVLDCRFVNAGYCHPGFAEDPDYTADRVALEAIAHKPTLPIIYFGTFGDVTFWGYDQVHDVMATLFGQPDVLFYPDDWVGGAGQIVAQFSQH